MEWPPEFSRETRLHTGISDLWITSKYKLTVVSELGECRNCSHLNTEVIVIE
jgi:hypothetical protein